MTERLRRWLADFRAAYEYIRDPHGWEQRRRWAAGQKFTPRPAMFRARDIIYAHPARMAAVQAILNAQAVELKRSNGFDVPLYGFRVLESMYCVEQPPEGGWTDVVVPERPRLAP